MLRNSDDVTQQAGQCPACSSSAVQPTEIRFHSPVSHEIYRLWRCTNCTLEYWYPRWVDSSWYRTDAFGLYTGIHAGSGGLLRRHRAFFSHFPWRRLHESLRRPIRILDIGCGDGAFLAACAAQGFDVHGLDFDEVSVETARSRYGLRNVRHSSLAEFVAEHESSGGRFDVITFFEVLEHQVSLTEFLKLARKLLADGGYISGTVPNSARLFASLERGRDDDGDLPPHHFYWFNTRSLQACFEHAGFSEVCAQAVGDAVVSGIRIQRRLAASARKAFRRRSRPVAPAGSGTGNSPWRAQLRRIRDLLARAILTPLDPMLRGRGETLFFFARRS